MKSGCGKNLKGPIQTAVGPKGGKKWRCGSGPWQYGEPPKQATKQSATKASAATPDPNKTKELILGKSGVKQMVDLDQMRSHHGDAHPSTKKVAAHVLDKRMDVAASYDHAHDAYHADAGLRKHYEAKHGSNAQKQYHYDVDKLIHQMIMEKRGATTTTTTTTTPSKAKRTIFDTMQGSPKKK